MGSVPSSARKPSGPAAMVIGIPGLFSERKPGDADFGARVTLALESPGEQTMTITSAPALFLGLHETMRDPADL
jgi:hypothetical protein